MQKRDKVTLDLSRLRIPLILSILILTIDQFSKYLIRTEVSIAEPVRVIDGFFQIVHSRNTGVAFGFLSSLDPRIINPILIVINILIMVFLILLILFEDLPVKSRAGFGLILGGAAGNLVDRISFGFVVDFLDIFIGKYHWPAFNVADAAITIGVILLVADTIFDGKKKLESDNK